MKCTPFRILFPISVLAASSVLVGCKKEEPPPPLPTAAPIAPAVAPAPLQLMPVDAGVKAPPPPVATAHGGGSAGGGLGPCCSALAQNANSAPEPTKTYMLQAAAMCQALNAQGMGRQAVGQVLGLLRGAGIPSACH